jgi:hypothetical protein
VKEEASYNCDNLDGTEPELEFTEEFDTEVVDGANDNKEDCHPHARIDLVFGFPFLDNQGGRSQLIRCSNDVFAPVRPAKSKSERGVNKSSSIASKSSGVRDPGSHLTESGHDDVDE